VPLPKNCTVNPNEEGCDNNCIEEFERARVHRYRLSVSENLVLKY